MVLIGVFYVALLTKQNEPDEMPSHPSQESMYKCVYTSCCARKYSYSTCRTRYVELVHQCIW